jgi:hypothetical protein
MKIARSLAGAALAGTLMFAAGRTVAFPLYLTSVSGTIVTTPDYSDISGTNVSSAKMTTVSVNMKTIKAVISNEVYRTTGTPAVVVPADARIAYDPYTGKTFLTNDTGFYHTASDIVRVKIHEIATSFRGNEDGGSENDRIEVTFEVQGRAPDGGYFDFELSGKGKLEYSLNTRDPLDPKGSMSISASSVSGYGEYQDSDSGVSSGNFNFRGKGKPEWPRAFSVWWWD